MSDNEIYLLIKYIKSVLWRVAKCLSYIEEVRCLKVKRHYLWFVGVTLPYVLGLVFMLPIQTVLFISIFVVTLSPSSWIASTFS